MREHHDYHWQLFITPGIGTIPCFLCIWPISISPQETRVLPILYALLDLLGNKVTLFKSQKKIAQHLVKDDIFTRLKMANSLTSTYTNGCKLFQFMISFFRTIFVRFLESKAWESHTETFRWRFKNEVKMPFACVEFNTVFQPQIFCSSSNKPSIGLC